MSFNKSPFAFDDVRPVFDRALASEKGVKVLCDTYADAIAMRSRFNYFRQLDREQNRDTYDREHPLHSRSMYDKLVLRVRKRGQPEDNVLFIEKRDISDLIVEDIT